MNQASLVSALSAFLFIIYCDFAFSQESEKVWFDGNARSLLNRDALGEFGEDDSLTQRNSTEGYNLVDLNVHVNPLEDFEIFAQLRVRNTFGGFFGAGTDVRVRQLRATGVVNKRVRFNIGDIFLKQSPFTLWNSDEELSNMQGPFSPYREIIQYESFYQDNRWRLQGLQSDFSFKFDRFVRSLAVDVFATRPRGSIAISNASYESDRLLCGGSLISQFTSSIGIELNYVNVFDLPATGTTLVSLRNPVYHAALVRKQLSSGVHSEQRLESGYSSRHWLMGLPAEDNARKSQTTEGMLVSFTHSMEGADSLFAFSVGARYVDPLFRSAASQTRRVDFNPQLSSTVYPIYSNDAITRQPSAFDLMTDVGRYNQNISSTLMAFNPMYSNVLPFGKATPNRQGLFAEASYKNPKNIFSSTLDFDVLQEVIGQGTMERRNFQRASGRLGLNVNELNGWEKNVALTWSGTFENTSRQGDEYEVLTLSSLRSNLILEAEVISGLFIQGSMTHISSTGNEQIVERTDFGVIEAFTPINYDQLDRIYSTGFSYKWKENVYANLQYNWWGVNYANEAATDYDFRRLFFVLSLEL
jgi:hypothetical protein